MGCPSELCRLIIVMPVTARLSGSIPREGDYKDSNPFAHPEVAMGRGAECQAPPCDAEGLSCWLRGDATQRRSGQRDRMAGPWQNNTIS
jgi:hypothetical protein